MELENDILLAIHLMSFITALFAALSHLQFSYKEESYLEFKFPAPAKLNHRLKISVYFLDTEYNEGISEGLFYIVVLIRAAEG